MVEGRGSVRGSVVRWKVLFGGRWKMWGGMWRVRGWGWGLWIGRKGREDAGRVVGIAGRERGGRDGEEDGEMEDW